ncbi:MAG: GreA/GreB family elongation factor [Bacteriovoracaceae bacterium]
MVNKALIKQILKEILEKELKAALLVEESLESFKKQDDMKAESKYDTRSTEAGYLASAHQKRLLELKRDLILCDNMELKSFTQDSEIALSALIQISIDGKIKHLFLSLVCGGVVLEQFSPIIQVISLHSPLGKELIGLKVNDEFEMLSKGKMQTYQVLSLL